MGGSLLVWAGISLDIVAHLFERGWVLVGGSGERSLPSCLHLSYWAVYVGSQKHGQLLALQHQVSE